MSSLTKFPQSKIKEIVMTDPDVKEISKQALEAMKNAAEIFAAQLFQKCFEESRRKKKTTCTINHFMEAIKQDEALNQMLSQFIVDQNARPKEEEDANDIENIVDKISRFESNSSDNSDDDYKQVNIEKFKDTGDSKDLDKVENSSEENDEGEDNNENPEENDDTNNENEIEENPNERENEDEDEDEDETDENGKDSDDNSTDKENEKMSSQESPLENISDISEEGDESDMEAD